MKKGIFFIFLYLLCIGLVYSTASILMWFQDNDSTSRQIEAIQDLVRVEEIVDNSSTVVITESDHIEEKLIGVDFDPLKKINNEVVGWIQVNGTNINYPFVQHTDNSFYLKRSFDRSYNSAGWVFLDFRNSMDNLNTNTIIYAHGRVDGTMFGTLKNSLNYSWFNNKDNHVLKISTPRHNYLFEVFSIYHIKTTSDYLHTYFKDVGEYGNFLKLITERSAYQFPSKANTGDKILTLSTCYSNTEKMVMHARLIKSELR